MAYACFRISRLFTFHHDCLSKCSVRLSSLVCVLQSPTIFHCYHLVIYVELFELDSSSLDNIPCRLVETVFFSLLGTDILSAMFSHTFLIHVLPYCDAFPLFGFVEWSFAYRKQHTASEGMISAAKQERRYSWLI
jgi:hypothetical protein